MNKNTIYINGASSAEVLGTNQKSHSQDTLGTIGKCMPNQVLSKEESDWVKQQAKQALLEI